MDNIDVRVSNSIEYITIKAGSYEEIKILLHQPTNFSWMTKRNRYLLQHILKQQDTKISTHLDNNRNKFAELIGLNGAEFEHQMFIQGILAGDDDFLNYCTGWGFRISLKNYAFIENLVLKTNNGEIFKAFLKNSSKLKWLVELRSIIINCLEKDVCTLQHFVENNQEFFNNEVQSSKVKKSSKLNKKDLIQELTKIFHAISSWEKDINDLVDYVKAGNVDAVKSFIDRGINVNVKDCNDMTPLLHAAQSHQYKVVEALLNQKAHLNHRNKFGYNALGLAFRDIASALPLHVIKTVDILTQRGIEQNPLEMPSVGLYANKELRYFSVYQAEALAAKVYYRHLKANFFREAKDQNLLTPEQAAKLRN